MEWAIAMGIKRRDLLLAGTAALGFGLGAATHGIMYPRLRQSGAEPSEGVGDAAAAPTANDGGVSPPEGQVTRQNPRPAPPGMEAPLRGDVRLVVFSDINGRYRSTDYIQQVRDAIPLIPAWEPDLVICAGDMVAGQLLALRQPEIQAMWDGFDRLVFQPIRQAGLPFALTIGNHDASSHMQNGRYVFELERNMASAYWNSPERDLGIQFLDRAGFPFYYAFMHRNIFYMVWDASSANVSEGQLAWTAQTLASDVAQTAAMRIAVGHLPLYAISQGRDRTGEILNQANALQLLLERHNVHTYISGHHHAYYPGHVSSLQLLHCGALGSGPRTWLNTITASIHTMTVVDIDLDTASTRYTTYDMTTKQRVDDQQLPRLIVGPTGRVLRRDISWNDLSPEERSRQHVPSE